MDVKKPWGEVLDILTIHAHAELSRWCGNRVTHRKLRQHIHQEIATGKMGTAEQVAGAIAAVLRQIVNKE